MKEYPKNRTDIILAETIGEDIKNLDKLLFKYRGIEEIQLFKTHLEALKGLLKNLI